MWIDGDNSVFKLDLDESGFYIVTETRRFFEYDKAVDYIQRRRMEEDK